MTQQLHAEHEKVTNPKVLLLPLGCDKNTVDTEITAAALAKRGLSPVSPAQWNGEDPLAAVVINTCGFIDDAKQQSVDTILEWADFKEETGGQTRLIVAGCLTQKYSDELRVEIPEIDNIVGVGAWDQIADILSRPTPGAPTPIPEPDMRIDTRLERLPLDSEPHRFLRISDGCNQTCTFCSIPSMKGRHRSVEPSILLEEAKVLIAQGARELNLIAQDLTSYGLDLKGSTDLASVIEQLDAIEGKFWIRLLYAYPNRIDDRLISTITQAKHVLPYLDMPLQHAATPVLRRMRRPGAQVDVERLIARLREGIPELVLRTTFIVGFPGETDEDFATLMQFVESQRIDRVGAFMYQPQEGTPSALMPNRIDEKTKEKRRHELMMLQAKIAEENQRQRFLDREIEVLVEQFDPEVGLWHTRSHADAPEVDGTTWVEADEDALTVGEFLKVKVVDTDSYDMRAVVP